MPINTTALKAAMAPLIGAEGTQRYTDAQDYIPAINAGMRQFVGLGQGVFAEKKGIEEIFVELTKTDVFQSNSLSGITLRSNTDIDGELWTILAVYAEPFTYPSTQPVISVLNGHSVRVTNRVFTGSGKRVRRMTLEEMALARDNQTITGNEVLAGTDWRSYGYYLMDRRAQGAGVAIQNWEVILTPASISATKYFGISYLKTPTPIVAIGDTIPFPETAFEMLKMLALNEIAIKQGDGTTLYNVTQKDVAALFPAQT